MFTRLGLCRTIEHRRFQTFTAPSTSPGPLAAIWRSSTLLGNQSSRLELIAAKTSAFVFHGPGAKSPKIFSSIVQHRIGQVDALPTKLGAVLTPVSVYWRIRLTETMVLGWVTSRRNVTP